MDALDRKQRLLDAVKASDVALVASLLKDGENINLIFPTGKTLLIMAIEEQKQDMVDFLIRAGANLEQRDFYDYTPLMYAARLGDTAIARSLLEAGARVNARNKQGWTALTYAKYKKNAGVESLLFGAGANWSATEVKTGRTDFRTLLRKSFSKDEFSELSSPPQYQEWDQILFLVAAIPLPVLLALQPRWSFLTWPVLAWVAWRLLVWFPSIWMLFPLGWEIIQMYLGKLPANAHGRARPARQIDTPSEVSFVSLLMDLGARELTSLHRTDFDRQSLAVRRSIFFSRMLSVLLASSNFAFMLLLVANGGDLDVTCGLYILFCVVIPIWTTKTLGLEIELRVNRLRLVQKDRDRIAGEISQMLTAEEFRDRELPAAFGLYLRAFMTTDKLHIKGFDFETMLAYSIAPTLPLVALGKPGEHLGAGRIRTTDAHWQEEILRLMETARLILIIPSYRPGTLWEISTLRERGFFPKTIFIMPPELEFHGDKYSNDWQKTVAAAREVGVEFPFHIPSGAFFRLHSDGGFEDYAPCLPEEFIKEPEVPIEGPWQARAGGSVEAAVDESSGMSAATAGMPHGLAAGHPNENNSFQEIDEALAAGHAESGSDYGDSGDDGSYAGYYAW